MYVTTVRILSRSRSPSPVQLSSSELTPVEAVKQMLPLSPDVQVEYKTTSTNTIPSGVNIPFVPPSSSGKYSSVTVTPSTKSSTVYSSSSTTYSRPTTTTIYSRPTTTTTNVGVGSGGGTKWTSSSGWLSSSGKTPILTATTAGRSSFEPVISTSTRCLVSATAPPSQSTQQTSTTDDFMSRKQQQKRHQQQQQEQHTSVSSTDVLRTSSPVTMPATSLSATISDLSRVPLRANVFEPETFQPARKLSSCSAAASPVEELPPPRSMPDNTASFASAAKAAFFSNPLSSSSSYISPIAIRRPQYELAASAKRDGLSTATGNGTTVAAANSPLLTSPPTANLHLSNKESSLHTSSSFRAGSDSMQSQQVAPSATTNGTKHVDSFVGFSALPTQIFRKAVKHGFDFTLMVVGASGLGKSTLVNSMFLTDIYSNEYPGPSQRVKKTVEVETTKVMLQEGSNALTLTIVDTPGFGDAVDNSNCWCPIVQYIDDRFAEYMSAETRIQRTAFDDNRVHCCLYFIAPTGHGLRSLDIEFMKRLHERVNIIPVIAKADTMTPEECALFKRMVAQELQQNRIKTYDFPELDSEIVVGKSGGKNMGKGLRDRLPFAVVGSNTMLEVNGKRVRGRRYPWGVAEVENLEHCDFLALRNMLIKSHMQDLKQLTAKVMYENYRYAKLAAASGGENGINGGLSLDNERNLNPLALMEQEKKEHLLKMEKLEKDMENVFELKVKEKLERLRATEQEFERRHEAAKKALEQQRAEFEEKRRNFEKERAVFDAQNREYDDLFRKMNLDKDSLDGKEKRKEKRKLF